MYEKIKAVLSDDAAFYALLVLLVGVTSFGLGRWSTLDMGGAQAQPASVTMSHSPAAAPAVSQTVPEQHQQLVASKNGTKYHLLTCPGAAQIAEKNKIYFSSKAEAESSGYQPAANCPGL